LGCEEAHNEAEELISKKLWSYSKKKDCGVNECIEKTRGTKLQCFQALVWNDL
jgi:hypothetical protein